MSVTVESIERAAKQLSVSERAALAHNILKDLDEADVDEEYVESLWALESEARLDAYQNGEMEASPMDDAVERIKSRIGK